MKSAGSGSANVAAMSHAFGARADAARALFTGLVGLLSLFLFRSYLLPPLEGHLDHDRAVLAQAEATRRLARRGRPRPVFYLWVLVALGAMVTVIAVRGRG